MHSRRNFLKSSSLVSLAPFLPAAIGKMAWAAEAATDQKVLVVIQMDGGNDGINTVVPYGDDGYGRSRKKLRLEDNRFTQVKRPCWFASVHEACQGIV